MAAFHFRFERLLHLRIAERDHHRAAVADVQRARIAAGESIRQVQIELDYCREEDRRLRERGVVNMDINRVTRIRQYTTALRRQWDRGNERLACLEAELEECRQRLVEADRGVRMLELLREKQQQRFAESQLRRQVGQLDELAVAGFLRGKEAVP